MLEIVNNIIMLEHSNILVKHAPPAPDNEQPEANKKEPFIDMLRSYLLFLKKEKGRKCI